MPPLLLHMRDVAAKECYAQDILQKFCPVSPRAPLLSEEISAELTGLAGEYACVAGFCFERTTAVRFNDTGKIRANIYEYECMLVSRWTFLHVVHVMIIK